MSEALKLTPSQSVTIVSSEPDALVVEASYGPGGSPPPKHLHPDQEERFEVVEGSLRTRVDGAERTLDPGDRLEVPPGAAHQMWNEGEARTRVTWETRPRGRTEQWFRELDRLHTSSGASPAPEALGALLSEYRDVFRLAD